MKLSVFCGVSVDGFLARLDDELDFLDAGAGVPHGFEEFFSTVDVIVLGRRTFEIIPRLGDFSNYRGKTVVALSTTPLDMSLVKGAVVEQMSGEPAAIVAQLASRGLQHAYIDGGITIQRFLAAGMVDRLVVPRVPVLIGSGIPLFGPLAADIKLRHLATRTYEGGLVQSEYALKADG